PEPSRIPEPAHTPDPERPARAPEPDPERPARAPEPDPERPARAPDPGYAAEGLPRAPAADYDSPPPPPPEHPASAWAERAATAPPEHPASGWAERAATTPAPRAEPPGSGYPRLPGGYTPAVAARETPLREALRGLRRGDAAGRGALAERLRALSDEQLLAELRAEGLPQAPLELLLNELGNIGRTSTRPEPMRHELCAEVLSNGLYFKRDRLGAESAPRSALTEQSAALFTWAVAPLARDGRYLRDLQELLHRMSRDRHTSAASWLRQSITDPPGGRAPDLPPVLWQQLLRDTATHTSQPYQAPRTQQPP
ncbi:hypothetical protein AAIO99_37990, partial [Streptomyces sp. AC154]